MSKEKKKVLIEDRFSRVYPFEPGDIWYPDWVGTVVGETDTRYAVKRYWFSKPQWIPKNGSFSRCKEINSPTQ